MSPSAKPEPEPAILEEFKRLFKAARREHGKTGSLAKESSPAHQAALAFSRKHSIPAGEALLAAYLAARQNRPAEGLAKLNPNSIGCPTALKGYFFFIKGVLLYLLRAYPEAIACLQHAHAISDHDSQGSILNVLGLAYLDNWEPDRAIEYFEKSLEASDYDSPGHALHNLGLAYYMKGKFDQAIEYYQKALDTTDHGSPGLIFYNLGNAYFGKGEHDSGIEYYRKALATSGFDRPGMALNTLANALCGIGKLDEALKAVDEALQKPDNNMELQRAKSIRTLILARMAKIDSSVDDQALVSADVNKGSGADSPESRMRQKLLGKEDKYQEYLGKPESGRDNVFTVLRGWSSAVTLLEGSSECQWRGGGYFLKWRDRGVVLDPGFDFLDNFHDAKFHMQEVDAVVVSHNHPDHNYDLQSLDHLRYEIYRRKIERLSDGTAKPLLRQCLFAVDQDTQKYFLQDNASHRGTPAPLNISDYERKRWLKRENGLPLTIEHFPVKHTDDVAHAVGIRLVLHGEASEPDFIIGYTSDTKYFEKIGSQLSLADHLKGCDVMLAHISEPDVEEFNDPNHMKKNHLGYNGLIRLIKEVRPKLTLVGEFWAGLEDLRLDLIHGLRLRSGADAILPIGLGFHLRLPSLKVECTRCKSAVPFSQIKVAPPTTPFGPLGYLCPKCLL